MFMLRNEVGLIPPVNKTLTTLPAQGLNRPGPPNVLASRGCFAQVRGGNPYLTMFTSRPGTTITWRGSAPSR